MGQKTLFGPTEKLDGKLIRRSAYISDCGQFRWNLRRSWDSGEGVVCFVMLNPSTADDLVDDPTIRRCIGFAKSWGYSTLSVRNLFAYRATDPKDLKSAGYPTGGQMGDSELMVSRTANLTVCAWGAKAPRWRVDQALELLDGANLFCLGTTKAGDPRHPLYVPASQELVPFKR
jgi:hypothetical protein